MVYAHYGFAFLWGIVLVGILLQFKRMKTELSFLPETHQQNRFRSSFTGINLSSIIDISAYLNYERSLVIVASPTCYSCHHSVEEVLHLNINKQVNFLCLLENSPSEEVAEFNEAYKDQVNIIPVDPFILSQCKIISFPTIWVIDENGVILKEFELPEKAIDYINKHKNNVLV
ncbi:hypothetical protein [Brevibacillus sp. SYSU BS000544]|uniref:hypothetical protein n=1 Tax=Brevibacillus sp. SYSU BS000544 TaxID=3416443 RepID=UPI003CE4DC65